MTKIRTAKTGNINWKLELVAIEPISPNAPKRKFARKNVIIDLKHSHDLYPQDGELTYRTRISEDAWEKGLVRYAEYNIEFGAL